MATVTLCKRRGIFVNKPKALTNNLQVNGLVYTMSYVHLTLEKHNFELFRFTYSWIVFCKYTFGPPLYLGFKFMDLPNHRSKTVFSIPQWDSVEAEGFGINRTNMHTLVDADNRRVVTGRKGFVGKAVKGKCSQTYGDRRRFDFGW